ncbi:hypothetical protein K7432_002937 [Basidiobolus ranarum]|uniref:N-acetyltransferase domain-containing protein n=1 Tax=Basidiobolus ranarum TaxID=34480 RepID=A0ABR2W6Y6_9FUNG
MSKTLSQLFSHSFTQVNDTCSIKILSLKDVPTLFTLTDNSRVHLAAFLPWLDFVKTIDDTKEFVLNAEKRLLTNKGIELGVYFNRELAGVLGIHTIDWDSSTATLGYWLGDTFTGHGLMISSTKYLVHKLLVELEINCVEIHCAVDNLKSRAIPERLNFKNERCLQAKWINGQFVDHLIYTMLREDWLRLN